MTVSTDPKAAASHETRPIRVALMWPQPRDGATEPAPGSCEHLDGLSHLSKERFVLEVVNPEAFPLNPFARSHPLYAGLDPVRAARMIARRGNWDVAVAVGDTSALLLSLANRWFGLRKPIVLIDPSLGDTWRRQTLAHRIALPLAERIVLYGRRQIETLENDFGLGRRGVFVPHRVDTSFFHPASSPPPTGYVLSVGNDSARDFECFRDAVPHIDAPCILHSRMAPAGMLPDNLTLRQDWLRFEALRDLYAGASVVVLPVMKRIRAAGINTLLEAMAMGRPVVVSDTPGLEDYVRHAETAWVYPAGSSDALADGVRTLLANRDLAENIGRRARAFVERHCAMPIYAQTIGDLLTEVVSTDRRPVAT